MRTSIYLPDTLAQDVKRHEIPLSKVTQDALRDAVNDKKAHIEWAEAGCPEEPSKPVTPKGRSFVANFTGSSTKEIEEKALAAARAPEIFGPDAHLTLSRDYMVQQTFDGRGVGATIRIDVIEPVQVSPEGPEETTASLKELLNITHDEGKMSFLVTVEHPFSASTVQEGVRQSLADLRRVFGPEAVFYASLVSGSMTMMNGHVRGKIEVRVYTL